MPGLDAEPRDLISREDTGKQSPRADSVLSVTGLTKRFVQYRSVWDLLRVAFLPGRGEGKRDFTALKDISFEVRQGEVIGIIGRNGSGKSTLLKLITGVLQPTAGAIRTEGRISALLELGFAMNPEASGLDNIYFYGSVLGLSRGQLDEIRDKIIEFADIGEHIHRPVKFYSSGMKARLSFAIATSIQPDILIIDEILSVGDAAFSVKSYARMKDLIRSGSAVLFVTHNLASVTQLCDRVIWLHDGELIAIGNPAELVPIYSAVYALPRAEQLRKLEEVKRRSASDGVAGVDPGDPGMPERISETSGIGEAQISSGQALISDVRIHDDQGQAVRTLYTGSRYRIRIETAFSKHLKEITSGLVIKTRDGRLITGLVMNGQESVTSAVRPGDKLSFEVNFLNQLLPGHYCLSIDLRSDGRKTMHHLLDFSHPFSVQAAHRHNFVGYVAMDCDWLVETSPPEGGGGTQSAVLADERTL